MAKTRIKTTPTRMQKEALMASAAVTTTTNHVTEHAFKKRLSVLKSSSATTTAKEAMPSLQSSTIIVQAPKRTNSISSATSTISHTSDSGNGGGTGGGGRSCNESPPPTSSNTPTKSNGPTMAELTENAIKTLNAGLLAKTNALALKNRKVYMITEKSDDANNGKGNGMGSGVAGINGATSGQKRKMYLIMEEKESGRNTNQSEKLMKTDNNTNASKKLTLFTDTTNGQLPQKFEKILPEILNCIQAKKGGGGSPAVVAPPLDVAVNGKNDLPNNELNVKTIVAEVNTKTQSKTETNERLPLTLPPKKNRTKIITTQIIPVNSTTQAIYQQQQHNIHNSHHQHQQQSVSNGSENWLPTASPVACDYVVSNNNGNSYGKFEKSSATPVIVNATTLMTTNGNCSGSSINANGLKSKDNGNVAAAINSANQMHKNINLSTDFLFLMKMLPKLESIEEPHKNYVKNCIEEIINQYASANSSMEP